MAASLTSIRLPDVHLGLLKASRELRNLYPDDEDEEDDYLEYEDAELEDREADSPVDPLTAVLEQARARAEMGLSAAAATSSGSKAAKGTITRVGILGDGEDDDVGGDDEEAAELESQQSSASEDSEISFGALDFRDFDAMKWYNSTLDLLGSLRIREENEAMNKLKADVSVQVKNNTADMEVILLEEKEREEAAEDFRRAEGLLREESQARELGFLRILDGFRLKLERASVKHAERVVARRKKKKQFSFAGMKAYKAKRKATVGENSKPAVKAAVAQSTQNSRGAALLSIIANQQTGISDAQVRQKVMLQDLDVHQKALAHVDQFTEGGQRTAPVKLDKAIEEVICRNLLGLADAENDDEDSKSGTGRKSISGQQGDAQEMRTEFEYIRRKADELKELMQQRSSTGARVLGRRGGVLQETALRRRSTARSLNTGTGRRVSENSTARLSSKESASGTRSFLPSASLDGAGFGEREHLQARLEELKSLTDTGEMVMRSLEKDREVFLQAVLKADLASKWFADLANNLHIIEPGTQATPQWATAAIDIADLKRQMGAAVCQRIGLAAPDSEDVAAGTAVDANNVIGAAGAVGSTPGAKPLLRKARSVLSEAARSAALQRLAAAAMATDGGRSRAQAMSSAESTPRVGGTGSVVSSPRRPGLGVEVMTPTAADLTSAEGIIAQITERQNLLNVLASKIRLDASSEAQADNVNNKIGVEKLPSDVALDKNGTKLVECLERGEGQQILNRLQEERLRLEKTANRLERRGSRKDSGGGSRSRAVSEDVVVEERMRLEKTANRLERRGSRKDSGGGSRSRAVSEDVVVEERMRLEKTANRLERRGSRKDSGGGSRSRAVSEDVVVEEDDRRHGVAAQKPHRRISARSTPTLEPSGAVGSSAAESSAADDSDGILPDDGLTGHSSTGVLRDPDGKHIASVTGVSWVDSLAGSGDSFRSDDGEASGKRRRSSSKERGDDDEATNQRRKSQHSVRQGGQEPENDEEDMSSKTDKLKQLDSMNGRPSFLKKAISKMKMNVSQKGHQEDDDDCGTPKAESARLQKLLDVQSENISLEEELEQFTKMMVSVRAQGGISVEQRQWLESFGAEGQNTDETLEMSKQSQEMLSKIKTMRRQLKKKRDQWKEVSDQALNIERQLKYTGVNPTNPTASVGAGVGAGAGAGAGGGDAPASSARSTHAFGSFMDRARNSPHSSVNLSLDPNIEGSLDTNIGSSKQLLFDRTRSTKTYGYPLHDGRHPHGELFGQGSFNASVTGDGFMAVVGQQRAAGGSKIVQQRNNNTRVDHDHQKSLQDLLVNSRRPFSKFLTPTSSPRGQLGLDLRGAQSTSGGPLATFDAVSASLNNFSPRGARFSPSSSAYRKAVGSQATGPVGLHAMGFPSIGGRRGHGIGVGRRTHRKAARRRPEHGTGNLSDPNSPRLHGRAPTSPTRWASAAPADGADAGGAPVPTENHSPGHQLPGTLAVLANASVDGLLKKPAARKQAMNESQSLANLMNTKPTAQRSPTALEVSPTGFGIVAELPTSPRPTQKRRPPLNFSVPAQAVIGCPVAAQEELTLWSSGGASGLVARSARGVGASAASAEKGGTRKMRSDKDEDHVVAIGSKSSSGRVRRPLRQSRSEEWRAALQGATGAGARFRGGRSPRATTEARSSLTDLLGVI
eukprot:TRINITY_DN20180_c0_g4_i1.p1 TRINITY_DN20180_c0_g4~~TRINITY_DN20180_c0_g4_i1.p1  ORF type:complete len:1664 (-),score=340.76 TRINITY_DN20180_c0_g4_i1:110-5101(-)